MTKPFSIIFSIFANISILIIPLYTLSVYDKVLSHQNFNTLIWLSIIAGVILIFYGMVESLRLLMFKRLAINIETKNVNLINKITSNAQTNGINLNQKIIADIKYLTTYYSALYPIKFDLPWSVIFSAFVYLLHPSLFYVVIALGLLIISLTFFMNPTSDQSTHRTLDNVQNNIISNPHNQLKFSSEKFEDWYSQKFIEHNQSAPNYTVGQNFILGFHKMVRMSASIIIIGVGALLVLRGELSSGAMIAASMLSGKILTPIDNIWKIFSEGKKVREIEKNLKNIKRVSSKIKSTDDNYTPENSELYLEKCAYRSKHGAILFSIDSFLKIPVGSNVSITGRQGSGKTIFSQLLSGYLAPSVGNITLGGVTLSEIEQNAIGYVDDNFLIEEASLKENIFGFGDSNVDTELLSSLEINNFINKLELGIQTPISRIPRNLLTPSVLQRLKLAYAFNLSCSLLVIDDLEHQFDGKLIELIQAKLIQRKLNKKSTILVNNDPHFIKLFDINIILENGKIGKVLQPQARKGNPDVQQ